MANEISVSAGITVSKTNGPKVSFPSETKQIDLSGARFSSAVQDIGTSSHEALTIVADQSTAGWAYFRNLDATNYVEIGVDVGATFGPLLRLYPGQFTVVRLTTTAVYAKANTAAVKLQYFILEP